MREPPRLSLIGGSGSSVFKPWPLEPYAGELACAVLEEAKAKEDLFLQKQLELEATVKMQQDLIAQFMNKQA